MRRLVFLLSFVFLFAGLSPDVNNEVSIPNYLSTESVAKLLTAPDSDFDNHGWCCQFINTKPRIVLKATIYSGQSNSVGGDNTGTNPAGSTQGTKAFIFYKPNDSTATDNGYFENLFLGRNNNWRDNDLAYNGPELAFAKQWSDNHSDPIVIFKYGLGGSALVDLGTSYANGIWQIDANASLGPKHYNILINNFLIPAITKLQRRGIYVDIVSFDWCQGETECGSAAGSSGYELQLKRLIEKLQTDLKPYNIRGANIKPIITRVHNNFNPSRPYNAQVRTAQENVAAYFGMSYINSDAYELGTDFTHWTKTGQSSHGQDVYTIFSTLLNLIPDEPDLFELRNAA